MKFRKKPVVIEAVQLSADNLTEVRDFLGGEANRNIGFSINYLKIVVSINTLEGTVSARKGDWIIRGVKGEFYLCKPDIFAASYEPA